MDNVGPPADSLASLDVASCEPGLGTGAFVVLVAVPNSANTAFVNELVEHHLAGGAPRPSTGRLAFRIPLAGRVQQASELDGASR